MKHPPTRPKILVVTNPDAINFLLDTNKSRWLEPFMVAPVSLKAAAESLDTTMGSYSYWLNKLQSYGLLSVVFEEKRRGTPIKYYWGAAEQFEFAISKSVFQRAFKAATNQAVTTLLSALEHTWHDEPPRLIASVTHDETGDLLFQFKRQGKEKNIMQEKLRPDGPIAFLVLRHLPLGFSDAKAFQRELYSLLEKYEAKPSVKKQRYQVVIGLGETD